MITPAYAATMARYNAWMNERLYEACAGLPDAERKRDAGAFFRSIHGTLNHILLADRVWMGRFTGVPFAFRSLDQELYADFDALRRERALEDRRIAGWAQALTPERLAADFSYVTMSFGPRTQPLWLTVAHFFNHQTHHRGQVTTLLSQRGIDPGSTDLIALPSVVPGA